MSKILEELSKKEEVVVCIGTSEIRRSKKIGKVTMNLSLEHIDKAFDQSEYTCLLVLCKREDLIECAKYSADSR